MRAASAAAPASAMHRDRVTPASSAGDSESSPRDVPELARRACEKCTRTKKRCNKALPACSRCTRLATNCCYDFVYAAPSTAPLDPATHDVLSSGFHVPADAIMSLLTSRQVRWRESADLYFRTLNPSLSVVHPELFARRIHGLASDGAPKDPQLALLLVCMHLVTLYTDTTAAILSQGKEMTALPAYVASRRILGILTSLSEPSVLLVQSAVLLSLFEFGHGQVRRAYVTIGEASVMANLLGLRPGKYVSAEKDQPVTPEDEENRSLYWVLFIVDRLMHVESNLLGLPFHVKAPAPSDLLPTINAICGPESESFRHTTERHPTDVSPSVPLGSFQRICQCAILLTDALQWRTESYDAGRLPPSVESFSDLESATRGMIEAMLLQTSTRWPDYYECFATCTCLLLFLYGRFLHAAPSSMIHSSTSDVQVLKALAGINFTVRIINDTTSSLNDHLARRPDLLAPCSPVTPYSAYHCLRVLSDFEHVITNADTLFHDIYSNLHFFARRWGVAGELVNRIETWLAVKDGSGGAPELLRSGTHG